LKLRVFRSLLVASLLLAGLAPGAVLAQEGVEISTPFPSVTADPGGEASFALTVTTPVPQRVDLTVSSAPEGWQTRLSGGGSTIGAVFTGTEAPELALEVDVPEEVQSGTYNVELVARGEAGAASLRLDILVEQADAGAVSLETRFPTQSGSADEEFQFDLTLRNDTNQQTSFTMEAVGPPGWTVDARPSGESQATTTVVDAGSTTTINVTASAPPRVQAGQYPIAVRALGGPEPAVAQLGVEIIGSYDMSLSTPEGRLNASVTVGSSTPVSVVVFNDGDAPLTDITLSSSVPTGWALEFSPDTLTELAAGTQQTVDGTLTAADNAVAGDYQITVRASAAETSADPIEIRTTVEGSPVGLLLALALLAVVVIGLFVVFRVYGRR
jgi:uncharacterized membrane protein